MSLGSSSSGSTKKLSGIQVQATDYGEVVPLIYGTNKASVMLIQYEDFRATPSKSGGKGSTGSNGWDYSATIMLAIGEGPIYGLGRAWKDKDVYLNYAYAGFSTYSVGGFPATPWGYMTVAHSDRALAYSGTAYVAAYGYALGDGATLGNHSFEVQGLCFPGAADAFGYSAYDAHIKDIVEDFVNNEHHGAIAEQSATLSLELAQMHQYCGAVGILISPVLSDAKPAHEWLSEWALIANAEMVWSEGTLKFVPYSDIPASAGSFNYVPDTTIRAAFDDDNVTDLIEHEALDDGDCYNSVTIKCLNRGALYDSYSFPATDLNDIDDHGLRPAQSATHECITRPELASRVAYTQLFRGLRIRNRFKIKTWHDYDLLEPLDFIEATDDALGLNATRLRVISVTDSQDGSMTIEAEEAPSGAYHA